MERERPERITRRDLLTEGAGAAGLATIALFWLEGFGDPARRRRVAPTPPGAPRRTLTEAEWRTLEAAQDRLLPTAPDSPGARSVNAIGYLDALLADPSIYPESVALVRDGAARLDARARQAGAPEFAALPAERQDAALRVFETHCAADGTWPGHAWLKKMLSYTLEAFFGDPVHGGNVGEVAWRWIGHRPGFPRPSRPGWRPRERLG
jgi:gluconate 2-dehydrogenase gamma chain